MKITVNVDCTPEEARAFMGLPDVTSLHDVMLKEMEDRMRAGLSAMDPESLFRMWMPEGNMKAFEDMQKSFWSQMMGQASKKED